MHRVHPFVGILYSAFDTDTLHVQVLTVERAFAVRSILDQDANLGLIKVQMLL
jgi:hypothetical protein